MHSHHHHLYFLKDRELNELYASVAVRYFAISMITVFIPIYLLKLGYSLVTVFLFYATITGVHTLFVIPSGMFVARFGFKHSIAFSIPLTIIFYLMLHTLESFHWPLFLLAVVVGALNAFFWTGFHMDFAKFSDRKKRGLEISFANIIISIFSIAGPVIGGLILAFTGFNILFILVSLLLFLSAVPLFFSKDVHAPIKFSMKRIFRSQKERDFFAYIGAGIETRVGMVLWPIFIFFTILNSYAALGFVTSLAMLFSLISMYVIGRYSDIRRRFVLKLGALLNTIVWGIKIFARTSLFVYVIDSIYGITRTMKNIPFEALSYDKANKSNILRHIMFREISVNIGQTLLFIIMIFISEFIFGFALGGIGSLLMILF